MTALSFTSVGWEDESSVARLFNFPENLEIHIYYFHDVFQFANISYNSIKTVRAKQDMIADNYGL